MPKISAKKPEVKEEEEKNKGDSFVANSLERVSL